MATQNRVNIGSGYGLLPDGTKPLPEPIGFYGIFIDIAIDIKLYIVFEHHIFANIATSSRIQ